MSGGYPPFNFYNEQNKLMGFDVDVAAEVAQRLGVISKPITTEWPGIIQGLQAGTYDGILGSMSITTKRLKHLNFSIPYYFSGAQVLVKKDSEFTQVQDLKGKVFAVVTGTTYLSDAVDLKAREVRLLRDDNQTLIVLDYGEVDAVITDRIVGLEAASSGKFDVRLLGEPIRQEEIAVAFRKSDVTLLEEVNSIIEEMHEDGTLSRLSKKWVKADITKP